MTCRYCKKNVLRKDIEEHERRDCDDVPVGHETETGRRNHGQVIFFAAFGGMRILLFLSSVPYRMSLRLIEPLYIPGVPQKTIPCLISSNVKPITAISLK